MPRLLWLQVIVPKGLFRVRSLGRFGTVGSGAGSIVGKTAPWVKLQSARRGRWRAAMLRPFLTA